MEKKKTLKDWRETIQEEAPFVDLKPYSHNIISLALGAIHKGWGKAKANQAIKDFGLKRKGWNPI